MKKSIPRLAALLMALALGAAACGSSEGSDAAAPAADATPAESSEGSDAGASSVLDISATAADGTAVNLSDYAGQDLMLWFWAPW